MKQPRMMTSARVAAYVALLATWWRRAATRRILREIEPHRLADIGITEAERSRKCAMWFWQDTRQARRVAAMRPPRVLRFAQSAVTIAHSAQRSTCSRQSQSGGGHVCR
jgi:uncharacterized protein YjiS (DUF1127 family)